MNINLGRELEKDTYDRINLYDKHTEKKIILVDKELLEKYAYKTAKIVRTVPIETYNLTDRYFGGNIYRCAILKNNPYVLLVDKYYTTLGLLLPFENMHMLTVKELLVLCERYKIKTTPDLKKDDIIELLKK